MKKFIIGCILLSSSSLASAITLDIQRSIFSDTLDLQDQQEWQKAKQKISDIGNYPLTYLTQYNYLKANLDTVDDQKVKTFIKANKNKVVSKDLQHDYLTLLATQHRWSDFLQATTGFPKSRTLQCHYLQANITLGKSELVWPNAKKIWLSSTSLPAACHDVYKHYEKAGKLTQKIRWERFKLAYKSNRIGLMRSLLPTLNGTTHTTASALIELYKKPQRLANSHLFTSREATSFPLLVHSIKRLARKDIDAAMQNFAVFSKKIAFTDKEKKAIDTQFATLIIQRRITRLFDWLNQTLPTIGNTSLIEQRIRYAIKLENWEDIDHWITQLPKAKRDETVWQYWQARLLENKGQTQQANELYQNVATTRSYHGFLAAEKLGIAFPFNANNIEEKQGSLTQLNPELKLIEELRFHQLNQQAKQQWTRLLNNETPDIQQQLGLYAHHKGWAHLSVLASIKSKSWDALSIRFPSTKPELFVEEAKKYQVEPSYIYAITRRESSFDEHAQSPVGASGYMQLMPRTAKETARKIKLHDYKSVAQLNQGELNVQLGTAYFKSLLKYYKGNRLLATAAYNAGPNRVDKWISPNKKKGEEGIRMDSWVDSIPYYETRAYVKSILVYNVIYQQMLNKPLTFLHKFERLSSY